MSISRQTLRKIGTFLRPSRAERDLTREVDSHLSLLEEDYRRRGLSPDAARVAARRAFGGVEQAKEAQRDARSFIWLEQLRQDGRYACRSFIRAPGFTIVVVLTLTLGIGAATTLFSLAETALLHPLPFPKPDRLVTINETVPLLGNRPLALTAPDLLDYEQQTHAFAALGGWQPRTFELSRIGEPERVQATRTTASLFAVLGIQPHLGRTFTAAEDRNGAAVCVISDALWRERFHADPEVLGRAIDLDRAPYEVIGVMPPGFEFPLSGFQTPFDSRVWVPMSLSAAERQDRFDNWTYNGVARLKPGSDLAQANADLAAIAHRIVASLPPKDAALLNFRAEARPLAAQVTGVVRPLVLLGCGAVTCLLLIACVNVCNLLLARGSSREQELAVRAALGATPLRLLCQLVIESLLLAFGGAVAGSLLAWWTIEALSRTVPGRFALLARMRFDTPALCFAVGIALVIAVMVGTVAGTIVIRHGRCRSANGDCAPLRGTHYSRMSPMLVVIEIALAVMLVIGAGLLAQTFNDLLQTPAGFNPEGAVSASLSLPAAGYPDPPHERQFYRTLIDRLASRPSVRFVGIGMDLPLSGVPNERGFTPDGYVPASGARVLLASTTGVSGQYLQAVGAKLVQGRYFTPHDDARGSPVVIVTQSVASQFWPDKNPVGQRMKWGSRNSSMPWQTVVGVVSDIKTSGLDTPAAMQIFVPMAQLESATTAIGRFMRSTFVVARGPSSMSDLEADIRDIVHGLDARLALADLQPLTDVVSRTAAPKRFNMQAMGTVAFVALLLAAIGVYGLMACSVALRTHEIGVRMALGAESGDVERMVLARGLRLAMAGVGIGVFAAALLAPLMRSLLFGVAPLDAPTFVGAALVLLAVAAAASYVPARRASRVDPQTALRAE